jgi:sugar (pentulose or hexulose) kinase
MTRDYTREPLMTPERIRYNEAHRAKLRAEKDHKTAEAAARAAGEKYRAALQEEYSALRALNKTLRAAHHGIDTH